MKLSVVKTLDRFLLKILTPSGFTNNELPSILGLSDWAVTAINHSGRVLFAQTCIVLLLGRGLPGLGGSRKKIKK